LRKSSLGNKSISAKLNQGKNNAFTPKDVFSQLPLGYQASSIQLLIVSGHRLVTHGPEGRT